MTTKSQIVTKAVELLKATPHGLRYSVMQKELQRVLPDANANTISGSTWNLDVTCPEVVYKPARGLFMHTDYRDVQQSPPTVPEPIEILPAKTKPRIREEDFYASFAEWLVKELEECTKAIPLGGNVFKDKWGTPDVVGVREPKKSDIVKFPTEIVCAEIKVDSTGLITAFGQACAYRLFSHKCYIVVPVESQEDDIARLDSLARIFGIGLILFDASSPNDPKFEIRARAARHEPDMFYVNRCMKRIEDELFN